MEVVRPRDPDGQHFMLREYLRTLFAAAPFEGEAWSACVKAFLAYRAIPVLGSNFTTLAPASFFLRLESREPEFGTNREGRWGEAEFRRKLVELGEQRVQQLIATDETRSWAIYLSDDLKAVLAFRGLVKPGPRFAPEDDERDVAQGAFVRDLLPGAPVKVDRLDLSDFSAVKVQVTVEGDGRRYELTFTGCRALRHPSPGNEAVGQIEELRSASGRSWFVFRSLTPGTRLLAIQADKVDLKQL